jgi:hypothetical protein
MTLWLPLLDYARSPRALVARLAKVVPPEACVAAPGLASPSVAALEYFGHWPVDARPAAAEGRCNFLIRATRLRPLPATPPGWDLLAEAMRPTDRDEVTQVYRRTVPR